MKGEVPDEYYEIPLGSASIVDEGNDVTLVSYGAGMSLLSDASKTLSDNNIEGICELSANGSEYTWFIFSIVSKISLSEIKYSL